MTISPQADEEQMSQLVKAASEGRSGSNYRGFRSKAAALKPRLSWLEAVLTEAVTSGNSRSAKRFIDVVGMRAYSGEEGPSLSKLLGGLLNRQEYSDYVETILEILSDLVIDEDVVRDVADICTSGWWKDHEYWPDLRKAVELIYSAATRGQCRRDQAIAALDRISKSEAARSEETEHGHLAMQLRDRLSLV